MIVVALEALEHRDARLVGQAVDHDRSRWACALARRSVIVRCRSAFAAAVADKLAPARHLFIDSRHVQQTETRDRDR